MTTESDRRELDLYETLLALDPAARTAHLDRECAGDADLRRRVESLLASEAPAGFLETPALVPERILDERPSVTLESGSRIGDFRIEKPLGAGGMGEVYLATDTRLRRTVAIKVVSMRSTGSDAWRKRFLTEAQAISALNHPNICTLHDIGQHEGVDYLVMEYLDGETLAERIRRKALSVGEAIGIADQIASALRGAHSRGILHRDLKPGNVMLTGAGAKVLDFGLAKFTVSRATGSLHSSNREAHSETTPGMVLGTVSYMSPEQARGETVDHQTDIWSFGCVLYEMLSRRQAFGGKTQSDCIAACLERDPDWRALPSSTPGALRTLLVRCLRKDREFRLHHISDARIELREARDAGKGIGVDGARGPAAGSISRKGVAVLPVLTALLAAALSGIGVWSLKLPPRTPTTGPRRELSITLPDSAPLILESSLLASIGRPSIDLSPDGSRLVYVAGHGKESRLYIRTLDRFDPEPIPATEGAFGPFFSPDGEWIGFFADERLHKVSLHGGRPVTLCEAPNPYGGTWGPENAIVFASDFGSRLQVVSATAGSAARDIDRRGMLLGGSISNFHWPRFLPDRQAVVLSTGPLDRALEVISIPDGQVLKRIEQPGTGPLYVRSGQLVFARRGDLYAVPLDLERLEVTGPAVPVITGVRTDGLASGGAHQTAISNDGTLAYVPGPALDEGTLVWSDHTGNTSPAFPGQRVYGAFQISPDGQRLAATVSDLSLQVWIYHFDGSRPPVRLTSGDQNFAPIWCAGGERVVFTSLRDGRLVLVSRAADGSGDDDELLPQDWSGGEVNKPRAVSPNGKMLLFDATTRVTGADIWLYRFDERRAEPWLQGPDHDTAAAFSPDGESIAYTSDRTGGDQVFVCDFDAPAETSRQISTIRGEEPIWAPDGDTVFYRNDDQWMEVEVTPGGDPPELLFRGPYVNAPGVSYDYDPRQRRFLLVRGIGYESSPREIRVILNAFGEIEQLAPPRKR